MYKQFLPDLNSLLKEKAKYHVVEPKYMQGTNPDGPAIILVLKWDSRIVWNRKMSKELTEFDSDPYSLFIFALNSPSTKEKCVPRLSKFFEFLNLNGTMQEKSLIFVKNANEQPSWALGSVIKFLLIDTELNPSFRNSD